MTKRIFNSICFASLVVIFASVVLIIGVLYGYFGNMQRSQLKVQTDFASQGVANEGMRYLEGLDTGTYRITWVRTDGEVLYDSKVDSDEMENHMEREEIQEAFANGFGESSRYSAAMTERTLYCARLLPDKTVLRLSVAQKTVLTLLLDIMQLIYVIIAIAAVLSLVLAYRLSKHIVEPLNELNLEEPLDNEGYDELSPLLRRMDVQQKQIQRQSRELRQKQREFETVTENMAESIILLNSKGTVLSINPAAQHLFGTDDFCVGQHILSVNRSMEISDLLMKAEQGSHAEKIMELTGGRYQLNMSPVMSGDGISGAVLLALNVTEKENAEQMRREFTANVSHELKTPLHTIAGCAELLENNMVREEDTKQFYTQIHGEARRMISLVEDIIRLSHLDEDADEMKREETDLYALAEETIASLQPQAANAHITMSLEGESAVVSGIPQVLQSILYNLCDNAIKYNRPGGKVTAAVKKQEDSVVLSVSDTGIGIPPEHQERVFERFYRVDKSRSKELGGTGLGLSIVKHGVRLHGAKMELSSMVNHGTAITVVFPA